MTCPKFCTVCVTSTKCDVKCNSPNPPVVSPSRNTRKKFFFFFWPKTISLLSNVDCGGLVKSLKGPSHRVCGATFCDLVLFFEVAKCIQHRPRWARHTLSSACHSLATGNSISTPRQLKSVYSRLTCRNLPFHDPIHWLVCLHLPSPLSHVALGFTSTFQHCHRILCCRY